MEVYPSLHILLPIALLPGIRSRLSVGEIATADAADPARLRLELPIRMRLRGGRTMIEAAAGSEPVTSKRDLALIKALRAAHALLAPSAPNWLMHPPSHASVACSDWRSSPPKSGRNPWWTATSRADCRPAYPNAAGVLVERADRRL
ncbi:hypothetical protein [Polymorphobacter sp.]|uniref:hypothetical protein n=1 Tax=Polymorphobacter sp. TaxID=1909290 RepID=UPI003F6E9106